MKRDHIYIEALTVRAWLCSIFPRLLWRRWWRGQGAGQGYVFDSSRAGMMLARALQWLTGVTVEPLSFRLVEVRDEEGLLLRLRIAYQDLADVQQAMMTEPTFRHALMGDVGQERVPAYLAKVIATISLTDRQTLWRALLTIQVCAWHLRVAGLRRNRTVYFMERRIWFAAITRYAAKQGIEAIAVPPTIDRQQWRRRLITPELKRLLCRLQVRGVFGGHRIPQSQWVSLEYAREVLHPSGSPATSFASPRPKVAVEYYGHLNVKHPERYSDLFFWQQSQLPASDVLMTFNMEAHPLDERKLTELEARGIGTVAMRPRVASTPRARVFIPRWRGDRNDRLRVHGLPRGMEGRWLREQIRTYAREMRAFWAELFEAEQVKVHVCWFRYNEVHCAIADALKRVGGVATIYQRAYDSYSSAETAVMTDVLFAFSPAIAAIEHRSRSDVRYCIATGYLGDHRFPLLREQAQRIRSQLQQHGAQRILAFTDENSADDARWHTGHQFERENYLFLLEQVLAHPWLGLVIKPKTPASLRRRLGPVAELLTRAEESGRCFIFEEGPIQGSYPPAAAALAADVMIHGHLCAATAGMESALAGVPTLLLDREGWPLSPFYRLGMGRVVFTEWESLWRACNEHWQTPHGIPGFGDWSSMLDELDPFRDGRAAERMGTYIQWLLEGFREGLPREAVMARAAERYAVRWGKDKVVEFGRATTACVEAERSDRVYTEAAAGLTV